MRLRDVFRRRRLQVHREWRIDFLGEQDGPAERELKASLSPIFSQCPVVRAAYLARVEYAEGPPAVALCLAARAPDPEIVRRVGDAFAALFARAVPLDILFLSPEQEPEIRRVCAAFYARSV